MRENSSCSAGWLGFKLDAVRYFVLCTDEMSGHFLEFCSGQNITLSAMPEMCSLLADAHQQNVKAGVDSNRG